MVIGGYAVIIVVAEKHHTNHFSTGGVRLTALDPLDVEVVERLFEARDSAAAIHDRVHRLQQHRRRRDDFLLSRRDFSWTLFGVEILAVIDVSLQELSSTRSKIFDAKKLRVCGRKEKWIVVSCATNHDSMH